MRRSALLFICLFAVLAGCKKDNKNPTGGDGDGGTDTTISNINYKGMGASNEAPEGTAFNLPAGIVLEKIQFTDSCFVQNWRNRRGAGRGVRFCMTLSNTTNGTITIELPPSLIFISDKIVDQNGIILSRITYMVPPKSRVTFFAEAYCLNKWRKSTGEGGAFNIGPVSEVEDVKKLAALVKGKEQALEFTGFENNDEFAKKILNQTTVQLALWEITEGSGKLTEEHKKKVQEIR
jgi:hypothetical protein